MKSKNDGKPELKPLPGSRQTHTIGMFPFVINLREEPKKSSTTKTGKPSTRRAVRDQYSSVTAAFMEHLRRELQAQELAAEVADYGQPNPFPVVTLTCSQRVANAIEKMPEVLDIYRDDELSLGIAERTGAPKLASDSQ